jgi:hypothetical protein
MYFRVKKSATMCPVTCWEEDFFTGNLISKNKGTVCDPAGIAEN